MLLSKLTKYLHRKSPKTSPREEKTPQEVTCVPSEEIRNSEFEIQNQEAVEQTVLETMPQDTTSHLSGSIPRRVEAPKGVMTKAEMREARELFDGLDDAEIHRLYKKVTQ